MKHLEKELYARWEGNPNPRGHLSPLRSVVLLAFYVITPVIANALAYLSLQWYFPFVMFGFIGLIGWSGFKHRIGRVAHDEDLKMLKECLWRQKYDDAKAIGDLKAMVHADIKEKARQLHRSRPIMPGENAGEMELAKNLARAREANAHRRALKATCLVCGRFQLISGQSTEENWWVAYIDEIMGEVAAEEKVKATAKGDSKTETAPLV